MRCMNWPFKLLEFVKQPDRCTSNGLPSPPQGSLVKADTAAIDCWVARLRLKDNANSTGVMPESIERGDTMGDRNIQNDLMCC